MSNNVLKGDYEKYTVINLGGTIYLTKIFKRNVEISAKTIESYEDIAEESKTSGSSAALRGTVGALLLGPLGLAAAFTARSKGVYTVHVKFKDGKQSIIEIDDKYFKMLKMEFVEKV
ncbi:hypothetical protein [Viridibacillus arvi]|uniref:hypothetical protein n=1 Tax=Viridibacillus arvi TaxID=263475 RepID=UPI0006A9DDC2|nr:hypothetical protein [Viridibacillus arvi]